MSFPERIRAARERLAGDALWDELTRLVEQLEQTTGNWPLDRGVREVLVALWKHGFWTVHSCEGHLFGEDDEAPWNLTYPTVGIEAPSPLPGCDAHELYEEERTPEVLRAIQAWQNANVTMQARMVDLLAEFYADRQVPFAIRLHVAPRLRFNSVGSEALQIRPRAVQAEELSLMQAELRAFGSFLRERMAE